MFKWQDGRYISRLVVSEKVDGQHWEHYVHWKIGDCFFCKKQDKPCIMIYDHKRNVKTDHELGTYHTVCSDCIKSSIPTNLQIEDVEE